MTNDSADDASAAAPPADPQPRPPRRPRGRKPVIGLAGFFGHGNYGDELFLSVFEEYLGDEFTLRILPDLEATPYFSTPVEQRVRKVDAVVIGGGDLVQPWGMDPRYFHHAYLAKPVFIVGVGVPIRAGGNTGPQVEKPIMVDRYRRFFNHPNVRFINARDPESAAWIEKKAEPAVGVIVSPDIVCALTLPPPEPMPDDRPVLGIVTRDRRSVEGRDDYSLLEAIARHLRGEDWRVRHIILGTGRVGMRDIENAGDFALTRKEMVYSEDLDVLSSAIGGCTVLASMKFHGSVVATMYGVPSMVLIPTSKNRNFMRRMGRDDLLAKFDAPYLMSRFMPPPAPIDPAWVNTLRADARAMLLDMKARIHAAVG